MAFQENGVPYIWSSPDGVTIPGKGDHTAEIVIFGAEVKWSLNTSSIIISTDAKSKAAGPGAGFLWPEDLNQFSLSKISIGYHTPEGATQVSIIPMINGSKNKYVRMRARRLTSSGDANNTGSIDFAGLPVLFYTNSSDEIPFNAFIPNNIKSNLYNRGSSSGEWSVFEWDMRYPMIANTTAGVVESYANTVDNTTDSTSWTNSYIKGMEIVFDVYKNADSLAYFWRPKGFFIPTIELYSTYPHLTENGVGSKKIVKITANVSYSRGTTTVSASGITTNASTMFNGSANPNPYTGFPDFSGGINYDVLRTFGLEFGAGGILTEAGRLPASITNPDPPQTGQFLDPPGIQILVYFRMLDGTRYVLDAETHLSGYNDIWQANMPTDLSVLGGGACEWGESSPGDTNWQTEKWVPGDSVTCNVPESFFGGPQSPAIPFREKIDHVEAVVVRKVLHEQDLDDPDNRNILYVDSIAYHLDNGDIVRVPASESIYQTDHFGTLSGSLDANQLGFNGTYVPMIYPGALVFPGGFSSDGFTVDETLNYQPAVTTGVTSHSGTVNLVPGLTGEYKVIDMASPRKSWIYDQNEILPWLDPTPDPQNPGEFDTEILPMDIALRDALLLKQDNTYAFDYTDGPAANQLNIFRPNLELMDGERVHGPKAAHLAANSNFHITLLKHDDIRTTNTQSYSLWYKPTSERVGDYYPGLASASTTMAEAARIITRDRSEFWSLAAHHGTNWMPAAYSTFNKNPDDYIIHNNTVSQPSITLANKHYLNYSDSRIESLTVNTSFGMFGNSSLQATSKDVTPMGSGPVWSNAPFTLGPRDRGHRANYDSYFNPDVIRIPKGKRWIISYYAYTDGLGGGSQIILNGKDSENPASMVCKSLGGTPSGDGSVGSAGTITTPGTWQRFSGIVDLRSGVHTNWSENLNYGNIGEHETAKYEVDTLNIRIDVDTKANTILFDGIMLEQQPDTGITTPLDFVAPSEYLDLYFSGISNTINGGVAGDTHALDYLLTSSVANQVTAFTTGGLKLDAWNYIALTLDYNTSNTSIYVYNVDDGLTYANTFELPSSYTANVGASPNWPTRAPVYSGTEGRGVALAGGVESANAVSGLISSSETLSALGTYDNIKYCARTLSYNEIDAAFYNRDKYIGPTYEIDWIEVSDDPLEDQRKNTRLADHAANMQKNRLDSSLFYPPYEFYVANSTYTLSADTGQQGDGEIYKVSSNTQDYYDATVTPYAQSTFILAETSTDHLIGPVHMEVDKVDNLFALYYEGTLGAAEPGANSACHIYQFTSNCNTHNISHETHIKVFSGNSSSSIPVSAGQYNQHLSALGDTYDPYGQNAFALDETTGTLYLGSPSSYINPGANPGLGRPLASGAGSGLNDPLAYTGNIIKIVPSSRGTYEQRFAEIREIANAVTTDHSCRVHKVFAGPKNSIFYIYEDTRFYPPRRNLNQLIPSGIDLYKNIEVLGTDPNATYAINANTISSIFSTNGVGDVKAMAMDRNGILYVSRSALKTEKNFDTSLDLGEDLGWIFKIVPDSMGSYSVQDTMINIIAENVGIVNSIDTSSVNDIFLFSSSNSVTYGANTISTPIYHLTPNTIISGTYDIFVIMEGASDLVSNTGTTMNPSSENTNFNGLLNSAAPFSGTLLASPRIISNVYSDSVGATTDTKHLYEGALWIRSVYSNTVIRITPDANGVYSSVSANVHGIMGTGYLTNGSAAKVQNNGEGMMAPIALKKVWR